MRSPLIQKLPVNFLEACPENSPEDVLVTFSGRAGNCPYAYDKRTPNVSQGLDFFRSLNEKPRKTEEHAGKKLGIPGSTFLTIFLAGFLGCGFCLDRCLEDLWGDVWRMFGEMVEGC